MPSPRAVRRTRRESEELGAKQTALVCTGTYLAILMTLSLDVFFFSFFLPSAWKSFVLISIFRTGCVNDFHVGLVVNIWRLIACYITEVL